MDLLSNLSVICHHMDSVSPLTDTGSKGLGKACSPGSSSAVPGLPPWEQMPLLHCPWPAVQAGRSVREDPRGTHVLCLGELRVGHCWHHAQHGRAHRPDARAPPLDDLLHIPREQPRQ